MFPQVRFTMTSVCQTILLEPSSTDDRSSCPPLQRFESNGRASRHHNSRCQCYHRPLFCSQSNVDFSAFAMPEQWSTSSFHTQCALSVPNYNFHYHQTKYHHLHAHHDHHHKFESTSSVKLCQHCQDSDININYPQSNTSCLTSKESMSHLKYWQENSQMRINLLYRLFDSPIYRLLAIIVLLFAICIVNTEASSSFTCPPVNLIHRLQSPNGARVNQFNSAATNQTPPECDCTIIQEGGWEIICYASSKENEESSKSRSTQVGEGGPKDFDSPDYNIDYNILIISFSIRYVIGRQVKITCDHGAPVFKPALFQGLFISFSDK